MTDEAAIIYAYNYYLLPCLSTVEQTLDWFGGGCLVRLAWFILSRMIDDIHYTYRIVNHENDNQDEYGSSTLSTEIVRECLMKQQLGGLEDLPRLSSCRSVWCIIKLWWYNNKLWVATRTGYAWVNAVRWMPTLTLMPSGECRHSYRWWHNLGTLDAQPRDFGRSLFTYQYMIECTGKMARSMIQQ